MHQSKPSLLSLARVTLSLMSALCLFNALPVFAEAYYDAGLKAFQSKKYMDAARYFEQSIKVAPWESNAFYYCALAYHYKGDFKNASEKYGQCVERFPGTQACNQSMDALKAIDPGYFKRKAEMVAKADAANKINGSGTSGSSGAASSSSDKDMGTVEGDAARVPFRINGQDKVVDVSINGRSTRAIFDPHAESTTFSRQQLNSLSLYPAKGQSDFRCDVKLGGVTRKNFPITVDDAGQVAKIGTSFADAFNVTVDEGGKFVDLKRKGAGGAAAASVPFTKDGKDLVVQVEINGRSTAMSFDPNESGVSFDTKQAKNAGIRVDEAEAQKRLPGEGPQRGEPGWVPDEDRAAPPKLTAVRMKLGPCLQNGVTCKISETSTDKYPKFGPDFISGGGYKFDIDYRAGRINLTRK